MKLELGPPAGAAEVRIGACEGIRAGRWVGSRGRRSSHEDVTQQIDGIGHVDEPVVVYIRRLQALNRVQPMDKAGEQQPDDVVDAEFEVKE